MGARADDAAARSERARAIGLFRYGLIREAADPALLDPRPGPAGPGGRRGRAHRPDRAAGAGLPGHAGPVDPGVAARRVRRAGAQPAPVRAAAAGRGGRDGGRAQAGEPRPDRGAGRAGSWPAQMGWAPGERTLQRWFADDPRSTDLVPRRRGRGRCSAGSRPRGPTSCGPATRCTARRRRPQDLPVRLPRRPLPGDHRAPVRVRRGHRAPGRRAAPGARARAGSPTGSTSIMPTRGLCRPR